MTALATAALLERFENEGFLSGAHAAKPANPAVSGRSLQLVDCSDAELPVEHRNGLGSDTLQMKQIQNRRRELGNELAVIGRTSCRCDLENSRGEILAYAGDFTQGRSLQAGQVMRVIGDDVSAVSICADLEWILVLDFQKIGNLSKDAGNGRIIQP